MSLLDRAEKRFGRFAIHDLMKYVMVIVVTGAFLGIVNDQIYFRYLSFDVPAILNGQIWRVFTFAFYPLLSLQQDGRLIHVLFLAIMVYLYYSIGMTLENMWGAFRFNLFYFGGILLTIIGAFIYYAFNSGNPIEAYISSNMIMLFTNLEYVNEALFLMFSFMVPEARFLVYFVIPVKAKWLGIFYAAYTTFSVYRNVVELGNYYHVFLFGAVLINFIVFYLIIKKGGRSYGYTSGAHYQKAKKQRTVKKRPEPPKSGPRHRCVVCGRTEVDHPELEFRYCSKCEGNYEYCSEHLYSHEHVVKHKHKG